MTKSDLINHLAEAWDLSKTQARRLVEAVFACAKEALRRGERVEIRGLGSFEIRHYGSYRGRNPRSGEAVAVRPKRLPYFRAGNAMKRRLNPEVTRTQELHAVEDDRKASPRDRSSAAGSAS